MNEIEVLKARLNALEMFVEELMVSLPSDHSAKVVRSVTPPLMRVPSGSPPEATALLARIRRRIPAA